jgi:hypothetical protein
MLNTKTLTMDTTKTLMLAAAAAMTIGIGSAMAQSQVPSDAEGAYYSRPHMQQATPKPTSVWGRIGAGASDVEHGPRGHVPPFNGDYGDLANPG